MEQIEGKNRHGHVHVKTNVKQDTGQKRVQADRHRNGK